MSASRHSVGANRLIHETSPYLLQHAHNPVDWYPWGSEALARARQEGRPILLSIGYSACHWCHVMAHESFEDPETAALMNSLFVNIKVDREERPDLDAIYMEAVQAMTGRGGWPMTVFLTPDGKPFYGGTYFPPSPRYGMPSFTQLLRAIADAWDERRRELESAGDRMADTLSRSAALRATDTPLAPELLDRALGTLLRLHDASEGGFGDAPKFPQPTNLDFLLQSYLRVASAERVQERQQSAPSVRPASFSVLQALKLTLSKMAGGGIYDQLGGGFHRYSTDARWLVPHFEKMLYDNAQLARTYLHAWQVTGDDGYRRVVEETLDYVLREMAAPDGGFYSTQDADSEGVEGKYFLWTLAEVRELLGAEDAQLFSRYHDVTEAGNFPEGGPGANILHVGPDLSSGARAEEVNTQRLVAVVDRGRQVLLAARERRVHPGRDEKILAEWNGLLIGTLAEAGAALDRADYVGAAQRAAEFVLTRMRASGTFGAGVTPPQSELRLFRTYKDGQAHLNGYLEDYAAVALGLLALYEATLSRRWLDAAISLAQVIQQRFSDTTGAGFYQTSDDHEHLIARRKDFLDSALPSGNSMTAELLVRLGVLLGRADLTRAATGILQLMAEALAAQPSAFGRLLCALDFYLNPGPEIAIAGDPAAADTRALLAEVWRRYVPNKVLALRAPGEDEASLYGPLLADRRQLHGRATAYVCHNYACDLPVTDPAALSKALDR